MISDWIEFGQVSAERDSNLSAYFYENGVLEAVIGNHHQFLILGRKGAGKTAVFQHLESSKSKYLGHSDISLTLSLQDYSWNVHDLLSSSEKASSIAYVQSWKYIIYLAALKSVIEKNGVSANTKIAADIISRIYDSPTPGLAQIIGKKLLQLSKLSLPKAGFDIADGTFNGLNADAGEVSFEDVQANPTLKDRLNQTVGRLTEIFEASLVAELKLPQRVFVAFDRIDEAWDAASFASSQRIISGLIGASETIAAKFKGALRPIIFLREDIFDTLDLNDKNKLRSDCGRLLAWSKDGLSRMMLERINFFARKVGHHEFSKVNDVFDKEQMRQQRAPFDYIMLRTMLRPRDFIRFFQLIKEDMKERKDNPFDEEEVNPEKLECASVYNAEAAYSEWLVQPEQCPCH